MNEALPPHGDPVADLPRAHGGPAGSGAIRTRVEDFQVEEVLGFEPDGEGEHCFLRIQKRGLNTHELARTIARLAGVPQLAVGYAGLKDRHAVTTQAFTVHLPGAAAPDWCRLESERVHVLAVSRHRRKLRRGGLRGNRFRIRIRSWRGDEGTLARRVAAVTAAGVPNYFGEQRFGRDGSNLVQGLRLFGGTASRLRREQRSMYLSALRAYLFNQVLAVRVRNDSWDRILDGELCMLAGTRRLFRAQSDDSALAERAARLDIHPTGPLCGEPLASRQPCGEVLALETAVLAPFASWQAGLRRLGLDLDRRSLRLPVRDLAWSAAAGDLEFEWFLPAGSYATVVLRELVAVQRRVPALRDSRT